ncbi:DUF3750 domain-containing protein [Polyangium mundeleinium]|uniref:DUF3750 domain-containing protein n=1 Tax=Polyangium mundeleinium TaxID=2995306 RepID=A0ABT5EL50_9BACT|nr:DUF3750 domain-containing protein [Polyangium mundeleinium]MDC0742516.1 DUF3750 domain-containing protein [Polyangium mundeleinium]
MNKAGLLAHVALAAAALTSSAGCVVLRRPTTLPAADKPYVAVLSGEMPEPITMVARHAWIVANVADQGTLLRYELLSRAFKEPTSQPLEYFGEGDVALHGLVEGDRISIRKIVECLDEETPRYNEEHPDYWPIPGPNSNTYVDQMLRRCKIPVDLPSTAIGKDYRGPIGISQTSGGTGLQVETWIAGVKLGLREGVELHILGLTIGVDWWPPALILPVNPGRLGFDDR